ncbi:Xaa-Pro dipeptidyl-peptidase, partial [Alienimonas sp. DA493]|uniref:Xaa-Pro dipeptidyl-peptidase n=1 Tax=Alienimonas sp. DA493 TaxID=3373605 RepID=UPI0037550F0C
PRHLFLLVGESDAAAAEAAPEDAAPAPRVFSLNARNRWEPADGGGPGRAFAVAYAEGRPDATIGLIPCGVQGAPISAWEPGAEHGAADVRPYDDAIARARLALRSGELKGILWRQGRADRNPADAARYLGRLTVLIARLRAELGAEQVPVLIGQAGRFEKTWDRPTRTIDYAHWLVAEADPRAAFVPSDGLEAAGDGARFSAAAAREFGRRCERARAALAAAPPAGNAGDARPAVVPPAVRPRFVDGRAAVVPAFEAPEEWVREDLWVETPSDTDADDRPDRVHVAVTRPKQTATEGLKTPAVLFMSPYYGRSLRLEPENFWNTRHPLGEPPEGRTPQRRSVAEVERPVLSTRHLEDWVPRGFAVVHASAPGTGLSQGCPTVGGQNEYDAPKAVIDWLCGRARGFTAPTGGEPVAADWCTGKVGMSGTSYNGTLALAAAQTGVEGLEVVIPVAPNTSYYRYYRSNGLVRSPGGYVGEDLDVLGDAILAGSEETWEACVALQRSLYTPENLARDTGDWNDYWAGIDMLPRMDRVRCALLMSHAFNDWNVMPEHSVTIYERAKELGLPAGLYMHQGGHGGPPPLELTNLWFTHFLYGVENDWDEGGRAWIVREGDRRENPTRYADYPHPRAAAVSLKPTPGAPQIGGLTLVDPAAADTGATEPQTETYVDNLSFTGEMLAQAEWTDHRLLYATPPLTAPVHVSGTPEVEVTLSVDRPAANLSVWLVALPWERGRNVSIADNLITRGWADPQNHADLRGPGEPLEPGRKYTVTFDLQPDDQIVPAGRRIGLLIFSTDKDFTVAPDPGARVTVDLAGTRLRLPVVGGPPALRAALEPTAPQAAGAE